MREMFKKKKKEYKELTIKEVQILHDLYGFYAVIEDGQVTRLEREVQNEIPEGSNETK